MTRPGDKGGAMIRLFPALPLLLLFLGCEASQSKLRDVGYGSEFEAGYADTVRRAKKVLQRNFKRGLDPDLSDEEAGELWTPWRYEMAAFYRKSTRVRAHVVVDDLGDGMVRVGVSVVRQLNDNIDNPSIIEEARWVATKREPELEARLEAEIAQRYRKLEPSDYFEEKYREEKRTTLRPDLVDRYRDVNLEEVERPVFEREVPSTVGDERPYRGFLPEKERKGAEEERRRRDEE